jgi:hypothetical protein
MSIKKISSDALKVTPYLQQYKQNLYWTSDVMKQVWNRIACELRRGTGQAGNTLFKINKKEHASPINSGLISLRGVLNIKNVWK